MKKTLERRPADFVRSALPDERLWELWAGIERGEAKVRTRRRRLRQALASAALLGTVVLGVLLGLFFEQPSPSPEAMLPPAPAAPVASQDGIRQLSLSDGSTLSLTDQTRAHVVAMTPVEVRVRLEQGSVECEVPPLPQRRFVVEAAGFEVVVKGTHFTVTLGSDEASPTGVTVGVERGSVQVREPPDRVLALLGPGQHWASERNGVAPPAASTARSPATDVPASLSPAAPLPSALPPVAPPALPAPATAPATSSPRALFERANAARLAGNTREAAAAFDELRRRYPADERAGYAAFMLGRMRLDTLGDPNGAVEAFSFAIAHRSSGFFLEDTEARLVEALGKAGRDAECRQAQSRFLASHPGTARAALVAKQCDAR